MRGILTNRLLCQASMGITPAHAGNTRIALVRDAGYRDHPRACGEYSVLDLVYLTPLGSPPRMRGIRRKYPMKLQQIRITPAHAGNTMSGCTQAAAKRDHPRACGEYYSEARDNRAQNGITPAHAGNTKVLQGFSCPTWDHPRACGEYARVLWPRY